MYSYSNAEYHSEKNDFKDKMTLFFLLLKTKIKIQTK